MAKPALAVLIICAASAAVVGLIVYFVTSSKAKERAALYMEKVLRIVEALEERLRKFEEIKCEARRAMDDANARAEGAERAAKEAHTEREAATERAISERERAARAERFVVELERQLSETRIDLERWQRESKMADRLGEIAGGGVTGSVIKAIRDVNTNSIVLHGKWPRPAHAMKKLDNQLAQIESATAELDRSLKQRSDSIAPSDDANERGN